MNGERAENIGIISGPTVVKLDWYLGDKIGRFQKLGPIVERRNCVTTSAGDSLWDSVSRHFVEAEERLAA